MADTALIELGETISMALASDVISAEVIHGELMLNVRADNLPAVMKHLRDDQQYLFKLCMDVTAVDGPERAIRFDVVYNLLSIKHNQRIRVKAEVSEDALVPSICGIYRSAGWFEREVWDMYGIMFSGHPDLRRILTDYGFEGHPLRKDFPTTGYVEMRYDDELKRVVYEPVSLPQEFRRFDFMSPWEGANYVLPGDEKADGQEGS
jgi:NADH-quinone oxidoreductase subunit C